MRIIFVRHGHPNYSKDCLTELGKEQAQAAAKRLKDEGIEKIFTSPKGRAVETAKYIAEQCCAETETIEFMKEISWGTESGEELYLKGHPWRGADKLVTEGISVMNPDWEVCEPYARNTVRGYVHAVEKGFDEWLKTLGFVREGDYYRISEPKYGTVVITSHGGSSSAAIAHMLNVPFPLFCASVRPNFTAITEIDLSGEVGTLTTARINVLNEYAHIKGLETENNTYGR